MSADEFTNEGNFDTTLRVIEAGYPLVVEMPLVFDLHEADRLQESEGHHLFFAINFDFDHMFELHLDELLSALRRSDEPPIHARAGRRALLLAEACIRSFHESRQITVEEAA